MRETSSLRLSFCSRPKGAQGGAFGYKIIYQRHPGINKIARWAIWHIFLTSLDAPYFASKTEKFAVSASLRSAPSVAPQIQKEKPTKKSRLVAWSLLLA